MRLKKILGAVVAMALVALIGTGTASATILTSPAGTTLGTGTVIKGELTEGNSVLHPSIGDVECSGSTFEGSVGNAGGASSTVSMALSSLTFSGCSATVTVLKKGSFEIHTEGSSANGNGKVTSVGLETTINSFGIDCIYDGDPFTVGFIIGAILGYIIVTAILTRTGGSAFCGSTAQWTAKYKITKPSPLFVD